MKKLRLFDSLKFMRAMFVAVVVACALFIAPAHAAILPAGYTELEYIESTGTQYIDTGIKGDMSYKYEIDFQQLNAGQYRNWGAFDQSSFDGGPNMSLTYATGFAVRWTVSGSASQVVNNFSSLNSNRHHIIIDNGYVTWDGVNKGRSTGHQDNYVFRYNLFLGTVNPGGTTPTSNAKSKYYSYKVWNTSGDLIQDLIPAKNSSGVVGMYDVADSNPETAFHTNAGTGNFVAGPAVPIKIATTKYNEQQFAPVETRLDAAVAAVDTVVTQTMTQAQAIDTIATTKQTRPDEGCMAKYCLLIEDEDGTPHWYPIAGANGVAHALPAGYTELQYIESTGTQYIDTGITGGAGLSVDTVVQGTGDIGIIFSFDQDWGGAFVGDNGTDFKGPGIFTGISSLVKTDITTYWESENSKLKQTTTINGVTKSGMYSRTPGVIELFKGANWGVADSFWAGKIFSFLLKRNGVAIRNFIPAKNSSGEVGMYDMVSGQFFTNQGTGTFTAGPEM